LFPEGVRVIANPSGTASGLATVLGKARVYVLPGVPGEVEAIFASGLSKELARLPGRRFVLTRVIRTVGISESEISARLGAVHPGFRAKLAYLPEETGVALSLRAVAAGQAEALSAIDQATGLIVEELGDRVYSTSGEELHMVVGRLLIAEGKTIAMAESCTGGLVADLLTEVPGISACLERGVVTYSNKAKIEMLGVAPALLVDHGAVSAEAAEAMARGVRKAAGTVIGLSTTGIAGPGGGSEAKPVGLVYIGLAHERGVTASKHIFSGTRHSIKLRAAARALDMIRCHLLGAGSQGAG
jgi:nicotinamide-nucleotide amidase